MKLELNNFIKSAADKQSYLDHTLTNDFAAFLGCQRWHTPILRPNNDPKYEYFRWSLSRHATVRNIRVMTFRNLFGNCIIELAKERGGVVFPNGWELGEIVETLFKLRIEYKAGAIRYAAEEYHTWQMVTKYLLNCMWSIVASKGSAINMGGYEVIARAREKVIVAVNKIIDSGGTVLHVNVDEIVYVGEQVEFDNVHHEKFNRAVFTGCHGAVWGNNTVVSGSVSTLLFDINDWNPNPMSVYANRPMEERREMELHKINRKRDQLVNEIREYMSRTLEYVQKGLDCDSFSL